MVYIESSSTDPRFNLALEQYVFDNFDKAQSYFMLWQNHNAIIVGKHQNTLEEVNAAFVREYGVSVVRRLSGGGAVYHDLGNLNFTFITDAGDAAINFTEFCLPIQQALVSFGVPAEISGRNDMTVEGKKISGNAQYIRDNRVMHHGTLLYDTDLDMLAKALRVSDDKIESKGIKSVKSRVSNIRPYMRSDMETPGFQAALKRSLFSSFGLSEHALSAAQTADIQKLAEQAYSQWAWNYGASPPHNIRKARRIEGCGSIQIYIDMGAEGVIRNIAFYGDFFAARDTEELSAILNGCCLEYCTLKIALAGTDISQYFHALDTEQFLALLLE